MADMAEKIVADTVVEENPKEAQKERARVKKAEKVKPKNKILEKSKGSIGYEISNVVIYVVFF